MVDGYIIADDTRRERAVNIVKAAQEIGGLIAIIAIAHFHQSVSASETFKLSVMLPESLSANPGSLI